ncbi:hypothetical protein [Thalassotalea piscium]|uniref:Dienelactone hydrolase n=1 Tax=Thalassotalea piscium TaxID=1230533 RepID=A0A7X0NFP8_9GAMM|nr:hypothetical protein [Thalassotalea piscium]MBB6542590.1 dienelactone hydrolase [Thalassotalea piscium]
MGIVLVSDVFGVTSGLMKTSIALGAQAIVDPYKGQIMAFKHETEAYSYFINEIGFDNYLSHLISEIELIKPPITLIGFSVGATTIWRLSDHQVAHRIKHAFCYYGSQIRNFSAISPCFKTHVILPKSEPHFSVSSLQSTLVVKKMLK